MTRNFLRPAWCVPIAFAMALLSLWVFPPRAHADAGFGIGSKAPALNIENWVQDGNGKFKPVEEFEAGTVYVVEFWATWCGPCVMSMPHLAELQTKYRDQGVRIISITDESLDEVNDLLAQKNPQEDDKTFDEITAAYSLTSDPDRSAHMDYMESAGVNGIPSAFLVGKTGQIEWIGHPGNLDEPLEAVLNDDWDREQAKKMWDRQKAIEKMSMLARNGRYDEALAVVSNQQQEAKKAGDEVSEKYWTSVANSLKMSAGKVDDEVIAYYREQIKEMKKNPADLSRFAFSIYGVFAEGGDVGPLAKDAIAAIESIEADVPDESKAFSFHALALMNTVEGDLMTAVERQRQAVDAAVGPQKERFKQALVLFEEDLAKAEKAIEKETEKGSSSKDEETSK